MASKRLTGTSYSFAASSNSAISEEYGEPSSWAKTCPEPITPSNAAPAIPAPLNLRNSRRFILPDDPAKSLERIPPPGISLYVSYILSSSSSRNNLSVLGEFQDILEDSRNLLYEVFSAPSAPGVGIIRP